MGDEAPIIAQIHCAMVQIGWQQRNWSDVETNWIEGIRHK